MDIKGKWMTAFALIAVIGCAGKMEMRQTGFLADYSQLQEDSVHERLRLYRNEDADIEKYTKVMIAPVEVRLDPSAEGDKFSQEDLERLTGFFYDQLKTKLEEEYEVVEQSGPDVMLLRAAITDLLANKVYLNLHWSTTLAGAGIGGAAIEAELVDSLNQDRILAFIDSRKGKRLNYTKGLSKWGHTEEVLELWSQVLVDNLKVLRGEMIWEKKKREQRHFDI